MREALATRFWFDEIFTLSIARAGLPGLFGLAAADVHPPLHYLAVWAWRALGGEGDLWLRTLSILFGAATVAVTAGLARGMFDRRTALVAAALLAVHRSHVYFSAESRMYVLLWLCYALLLWFAWRWIERGRRWDAVGFALAATAALYTHYQAAIVLSWVGIWGLIALHRDRRRLLQWIGLSLAVAVLFAPQLPTFLAQLHRVQVARWAPPASPGGLHDFLRQMSFGASYLIPPLILLAALPLFNRQRRRGASLLWMFGFPLLLYSYVDSLRAGYLFTPRYMFFILPAWCALIAAGATGLRWKWPRRAVTLAVLALGLRSLALHQPHLESVSLDQAEAYLERRVRPGDLVFHAETHSMLFFTHYMSRLGRHRLLLADPPLAYYEGALFIPDSLRATPGDLARARASGARWWGVHTRHASRHAPPAFRLLLAGSRGVPLRFGLTTVMRGMASDSADAEGPARVAR
ncbi:MAG: glycosyltransferase family 39 protein [Candidatus Eisenbacteria bacterium]|nr:glycosyltransferase family 39 protein [Candidatus Eisenbacteria bacterium]